MPTKNKPAMTIFYIMSEFGYSNLLLASWIVQTSVLAMPAVTAGLNERSFVEKFSKYVYEDENAHFLKKSMLDHVGLDFLPELSREDVENVEVPYHLKKRYEDLKSKHDERHRVKRSSLAALFSKTLNNPAIQGDIMYSDPFREKLEFEMDGRIPKGTVVTMAELRLYKTVPDFEKLRKIGMNVRRRYKNMHPALFLRNHPGRYMKPVRHARVSIYHHLVNPDGSVTSTLIDSRKIHVNGSGWQAFDVTDAVHQWQLHPTRVMTMTLEMWIEGTRPTRQAVGIAKLVRFTGQKEESQGQGYRPELVVFTEEERNTAGTRECRKNSKPKRRKCCRDNYYVNFREMEWTKFWILEPAGYEAYQCDGKCAASRRRGWEGFSRTCSVAESAPLPIMYLTKRGDVTAVEVTEFPNMIVTRCGCSLDNVFLSV